MFCKQCGNQVPEGTQFCNSCGAPVIGEKNTIRNINAFAPYVPQSQEEIEDAKSLGIIANFKKCLSKYVGFSGRASRGEYWKFVLVYIIVYVALWFLTILTTSSKSGGVGFFAIVTYLWSLALFLPSLAVSIRRLHDISHSGWMFLINLIPIIGGIWFLILMLKSGDVYINKYGKPTNYL